MHDLRSTTPSNSNRIVLYTPDPSAIVDAVSISKLGQTQMCEKLSFDMTVVSSKHPNSVPSLSSILRHWTWTPNKSRRRKSNLTFVADGSCVVVTSNGEFFGAHVTVMWRLTVQEFNKLLEISKKLFKALLIFMLRRTHKSCSWCAQT